MTGGLFTYPRLRSFLGLLVSPSRGLLVHSPVLIFAFVGVFLALYRRVDPLLTYIAAATVLTVLFYSTYLVWYGAFSFSYRYLADLLPGLILLLTLTDRAVLARKWTRNLFVLTVGFSVGIQMIGAFCFPCGWYDSPVSASIDQERFWDWSDPQFVRCLRCGPVDPDGLRFLRDVVGRWTDGT